MADARIKDLTTTADAPAPDDYEVLDGPTNGTRKILASRRESMFAARAPSSGGHFTGTGYGKDSTSGGGLNLGAKPFFIRLKAHQCSTASAGLFAKGGSTPGLIELRVADASNYRIIWRRDANNYQWTFPQPAEFGDVVVVFDPVNDTKPSAYIDGIAQTVTVAFGSYSYDATYDDSSLPVYVGARDSAANPFVGVITLAEYGNVALSAAEVATLHAYGWAGLRQYVHAGGAGQVLYESDFSAGADSFTALFSTSVTGNTDSIFGEDDNLLLEAGSTSITGRRLLTYSAGKRFNFTGSFAVPTANVSIEEVELATYSNALTIGSRQAVSVDSFGELSWDFTALAESGLRFIGRTSAGGSTATTGDKLYARALAMTSLGLCGSWDFSEGAGYQQRDLSGAGNRMTLTTSGISRLNPGDMLQVKATVAHGGAGNLQIHGQAILPDLGWRLNSIVAESDAGVTIQVGNASGGAQLVAPVALTANTPKDLTVVAGAAVPTTVNAWSNSSGAANITYTLTYVRSDIS